MLNDNVKYILNTINKKGFEAFVVGGAVRNYLLHKDISDFDITTNALPSDIELMFEKTIPTGKKYGTITVVTKDASYEITTYRSDGVYSDKRRPDSVTFSNKLVEDLKRRDFTINAMCMDINEQLIDMFNGKDDLKHKLIRCIGDPNERFKEDALRMLRAVRFMCQLGFKIEENTLLAITRNSELLKSVSAERIQEEFNKILLSDKPSDGIRVLVKTQLIKHIMPELLICVGFEQKNPYHDKDVFEHIMTVLDNTKPKLRLRLAALLHDICKPQCFKIDDKGIGHFHGHHKLSATKSIEIMKRLKYSNQMIEDVSILIRYHYLKEIEIGDKGIKKFINNVGVERLNDMFNLNIADISGKANPNGTERVDNLRTKCKIILERKEPLSLKDLAINGCDLKKIGITEGKIYSELLNSCLDLILENPEKNNKDNLIDFVKDKLNNLDINKSLK